MPPLTLAALRRYIDLAIQAQVAAGETDGDGYLHDNTPELREAEAAWQEVTRHNEAGE